jgi:hypothetical protein
MATRVICGLECNDFGDLWNLSSPGGGSAINTTGGAGDWSRNYAQIGTSDGLGTIPGQANELYFAGRFRWGIANIQLFYIRDTNQQSCVTVRINALAQVSVTDAAGLVIAGTTALSNNAWHLIELHVKMGDAGTGIIQVRLDGFTSNEIDNTTTVDTKPGTATSMDQLGIGNGIGNGFYYDDIIICDTTGAVNNTWIGDTGVWGQSPDGDATSSIQWLRNGSTYGAYDTEVVSTGTAPWAVYRLDETSGTSAADSSGNGRNGTYESSPGLGTTTNRTNIRSTDKAALFSGSNDVLLPSGAMDLATATSPFSAEVWFQMSAGGGGTQTLLSGRNSGSANGINYIVLINGGANAVRYTTRDSAGNGLSQLGYAFSNHDMRGCGHWHHVIVTRDSAKLKTIYLDGVAVASGSDTMGTGTGTTDWSYIARDRQDATFFQGYISEVNIFQAALSAAEAKAHYNASAFSFEQVDDGKDSFAPLTYDDDNSFVSSSTTGDRDLYTMQDFDTTLIAAGAIKVYMRAKKTDPGTRTLTPVYKTSGAEQSAAAQAVATSYGVQRVILDVDATDSAAWTGAKLTALQLGPKATT